MGRKRNDEKIQVVNIRMVKEPSIYSESRISCPEDAVKAIAKDMATYDREVFAVMNLKTTEYLQHGNSRCFNGQSARGFQVKYPE